MNTAMKKRIQAEKERQALDRFGRWFFLGCVMLAFGVLAFGGERDVPVQSAPSVATAPDACTPANALDAIVNRTATIDCVIDQAQR
jgi:hypothetical protein